MPAEGTLQEGQAAPAGPRYAAFISYSHTDDGIAEWLHRHLENYRVPKGITGGRADRRIGKVFRDRVELASSHDLGGDIRRALDQSDALILMCSPRAARSPYVEEEIRRFKETGKGERIFAVIIDGEPHAAGKPGRSADEECFPRGLLFQVGADGAFTTTPEPKEPIAADVRPGKDGRENGALKIIAGLLGIGLDDLVQREKRAERARRVRANLIAGAMALLALGAIAGGVFAWQQQVVASTERVRAERQTADALARLSNNVARESRAILDQNNYTHALLMALYADPAARSTAVPEGLAPVEGYPQARARLVAAHQHNRLVRILGDGGSLSSAAFSADGRLVVTSNLQGKVRIWDAQTGVLLRTLVEQDIAVFSAVFSPVTADNRQFVATGSGEHSVRIWDAETGALVRTLEGHTSPIRTVAFSADGRFLVSGSNDHTARIWDVATGKTLRTLVGHQDRISSASFSRDGRFVVTGSSDRTARIWNAASGAQLRALNGHEAAINTAAFSTDGRFIVTSSVDQGVRIWDALNGALLRMLAGHRGIVSSAAFSSDGRLVVTASMDGAVRIFDAGTSALLHTLAGHTISVESAAFSADDRFVVTSSYDGTARIWEVAKAPVRRLQGAEAYGLSAALSSDGTLVATGSYFGPVRVWDAQTGATLRMLKGHTTGVNGIAFSPVASESSRLIATASQDKTARIWEATTGALLHTLEHGDWVYVANFSVDGQLLVTGSRDRAARIWDVKTGQVIRVLEGHADWVYSATFSPDARLVVTGSQDGRARIWDASTGVTLHTLEGHSRAVVAVAFSADGRFVATASADGTARMWDAATGAPVRTLEGHLGALRSIAFSSDGHFLVTSSDDRTARIWDAATGATLRTLEGHQANVFSSGISADARLVMTSSPDGALRLWDVPEMLRTDASKQVELACNMLHGANAPLAFKVSEIAVYAVLDGQETDPAHSELLASPCRGILPDSVFDPATVQDAWARVIHDAPKAVVTSSP